MPITYEAFVTSGRVAIWVFYYFLVGLLFTHYLLISQ
jgi:hypothetical protein